MTNKQNFTRRYITFFAGVFPSSMVNTFLQNQLYDKFSFLTTLFVATIAGFLIKYVWDYIFVFQISIQNYLLSSIVGTLTSLILEYILINFVGITLSAILALSLGYNIKFFMDQNAQKVRSHCGII